MAVKKSQLYSSLWKSCDELRGGMDASQYKDYVLVLLFVKYVSDKYAGQPNALIEIPEGGGFTDMVALKGDKEIGDKMNKIIAKLAEANDLRGVIDLADFNDPDKLGKGPDMQGRLSKLIGIFENPALNFKRNDAQGDDILGDAYEYLMRHFATESGKSKGQFYTPAEVSRVMAKVIGISSVTRPSQTIYDPACGSGSLLLKAADEAETGVTIYGQEMDNATAALAKMNMILHNHPTAEIWQDNTLSRPHFLESDGKLKTFDFAVANPPFSTKAWSTGFDPSHDVYERFNDGVPPAKNGDYAFLLHLIRSLKSTGKGAIILPHGVLFRGNVEAEIRKKLVQRGLIKGIIGLPPNLFYGTSIPACIIVIDKEYAAGRTGIFMIDASRGFVKDGNKNRLRYQDIHKIVDVFERQVEAPKYSRMVSLREIAGHAYNLNIPRYIDTSEEEDLQDIEAHLLGGIPDRDIEALDRYWRVFPTMRDELFVESTRAGYSEVKVDISSIKQTILAHSEFVTFQRTVMSLFEKWKTNSLPRLRSVAVGSRPKQIIEVLAEDLLEVFADAKLLDKYDTYQHLMRYWSDVMQDDLYLIAADGWTSSSELIPTELMITRYFRDEKEALGKLEAQRADAISKLEELAEEYGGEGGLLEEVKNDKGVIDKASVNARLRTIFGDLEAEEERRLLTEYLSTIDALAAIGKRMKKALEDLNAKVAAKYKVLSEDDVKELVVCDKWFPAVAAGVYVELNRVSLGLSGRVKELGERYASPLSELSSAVEMYSSRVAEHFKKLGYTWS